jgi:23S rRNA pseudouridine1911/1915/1917 synthase
MTNADLDDDDDYKGNSALEPWHGKVPEGLAGIRVDQALATLLPEYSRNRLQNWIRTGNVLINGQNVGVRDKVWGGESVTVFPEADPTTQPDEPEAIALDIVFEDPAILVINKPAGMVVHPGSGNHKGTLLNALLHHTPGASELPRAGIVHRLDKDTSGLMVVAKTVKSHTDLVRQMQGRTVKPAIPFTAPNARCIRWEKMQSPIMSSKNVFRVRPCFAAAWKPAAPIRFECT